MLVTYSLLALRQRGTIGQRGPSPLRPTADGHWLRNVGLESTGPRSHDCLWYRCRNRDSDCGGQQRQRVGKLEDGCRCGIRRSLGISLIRQIEPADNLLEVKKHPLCVRVLGVPHAAPPPAATGTAVVDQQRGPLFGHPHSHRDPAQ